MFSGMKLLQLMRITNIIDAEKCIVGKSDGGYVAKMIIGEQELCGRRGIKTYDTDGQNEMPVVNTQIFQH